MSVETAAAPPGPRGSPLLGVFSEARRNPLAFFLDSRRQYGDVVSMRFGTRRLYLLAHPDDIKHVLQDHAHAWGKSAPAARIRPLFGDSLTTIDGERWRRRRRLIRPALQPKDLDFWMPVIAGAIAEMLERWQRIAARGETVDVLSEMRGLTRAIILRGLFGEIDPARARAVGEALDLALDHADRRLWSPLGWLTPAPRRFRHAIATVDRFIGDMLIQPGASSTTVLAVLRDARDVESGERMREDELAGELKALLVAGHTTTTSALGWTWHVLGAHPEAGQRLRHELRAVLGGRVPGMEDLPALAYTRRLIDEVLRLYPPTWLTARTPLGDEEIRGYRIARGSIVVLSPFVTHRHPAFWAEPERFDPERFTPAPAARRPRFAYFPFGGGPRSCIGSWLATAVLQLVVATVAPRFEPALVAGARVDMRPGLTLAPAPGLPMTLRACNAS